MDNEFQRNVFDCIDEIWNALYVLTEEVKDLRDRLEPATGETDNSKEDIV